MFSDLSVIGLDMVMRRNDGHFYAYKTLLLPLSCVSKKLKY